MKYFVTIMNGESILFDKLEEAKQFAREISLLDEEDNFGQVWKCGQFPDCVAYYENGVEVIY